MNKYQKTLWMGNIEPWMSYSFLTSYLNSIRIFPQRITLKNPSNKRGCAFLEFGTKEQAEFVLHNFNGKKIKNLDLKFNLVKTFEEKYSSPKITKFTVSKRKYLMKLMKQLFIGNIDKSIDFTEVKKYFYERYSSIISAKLITNQQTGRSKGFGFIEFTNYKEFQTAMSQKDPIIFGKQKLVFNSAKNKYDSDDEIDNDNIVNNSIGINNINKSNLNEIKLKSNSADSFNENESCDTAFSNALISRDSNWSNNSNNTNYLINTIDINKNKNFIGFLGENKIPDVKKIYKEEDANDNLTLQIKFALKKMEQEYFLNYNCGKRSNYNYCEYFFNNINKIWENNDEKLIKKNINNFKGNNYLKKFS